MAQEANFSEVAFMILVSKIFQKIFVLKVVKFIVVTIQLEDKLEFSRRRQLFKFIIGKFGIGFRGKYSHSCLIENNNS